MFEALIILAILIPLLFCAYYLCAHSKRIAELELENKLAHESIKALHERIYHLSKKH